jgi:hypothetical protein
MAHALGVVLAASLFGSAAIGFLYAALYAAPELQRALAGGAAWSLAAAHLVAAVLFASLQLVAGALVLRGRPRFFAWLAPPALYLFAIGMFAWLASGETKALWLDSARGLWLLGLGALHRRSPGERRA